MTAIAKNRNNKIPAVIYARVSSAAQLQKGHGIESQITRCREFARMKGYEVTEVFTDEAVSGGVTDRPGILAMLKHLGAQKHVSGHVVIIDDISRIARDIKTHLDLRAAIAEVGAKLESPSIEFGEDSDSILVENLLASVSQHQRQKNTEQTKNRMRARMLNGYWPFTPCLGFKFKTVPGRGKVLVRDEPLASIIQEALEGYASGRFQLQAEVKRFLESQPAFPKNRFGIVTDDAANRILTRLLYAGMVERKEWGVSLRPGQHAGLVSYETFQKIQMRLKEGAKAPARADINADFPLRGAIACADCSHPMTACWSKSKTGAKHPYYMCFKRGCKSYRKSIRRDKVEGDFAALLTRMQPAQELVTFARGMFRDIWTQLSSQSEAHKEALEADIRKADNKIEQLLDRIVQADNPSVIAAYEKRIAKLESDKHVLAEKLATTGQSKGRFEELFELSMEFLGDPQKLWASGKLEHRQTVLKLAFADRLTYSRERGFSNPEFSIPFKLLGSFCIPNGVMAEREGFEPSKHISALTPLAGERLQPLGHLSGAGTGGKLGDFLGSCKEPKCAFVQFRQLFLGDGE